jgi:uncharacterized ferritin-like protein (DUF455 family)
VYISPLQISELALSLAEIELFRLRQLAWQIPSSPSFELHCFIGLEIGLGGRRIQALISSISGNIIEDNAPTSTPDWEYLFIEPSDSYKLSAEKISSYEDIYETVFAYAKSVGLVCYDFQNALRVCCQLIRQGNESIRVNPPLDCSSDNVVKRLLDLASSRKERVLHKPTRSRHGNSNQKYDPRWQLIEPGFALPRMLRIENEVGLLHKLHHTAFRETFAAEIAALNLFEYDGMPWSFYLDMARQVEDETRHALLGAKYLHDRGGKFGQFPISHFGNFYQMYWEMTLCERLVSLNLDIEAVGQALLTEISSRLDATGDTEISRLFEFISVDEQRHARIGGEWFRYLYPEPELRKYALEAARAMTVFHLASAHTVVAGGHVADVIDSWLSGESPIKFTEPQTVNHEKEVTLLTARRGGYRKS